MPRLTALSIQNFRNLSGLNVQPASYLNLIYGENGAGKTSILEAISVLAHAKSFRTHKFRHLVQSDAQEFTVFGEVKSSADSPEVSRRVGVQRNRTTKNISKVDGEIVRTSAQLADLLPLKIIDAHSFELLEGSSSQRRKVLDWLVFHVKPSFRDAWKGYIKCLKHRNLILKEAKTTYNDLRPWDIQLADFAESMHNARAEAVAPLKECFERFVKSFYSTPKGDVHIHYSKGWEGEASGLLTVLEKDFERDLRYQRTNSGAHKCDFSVRIGNLPAVDILSRGQQKSVICAIHIAEAFVFKSMLSRTPVFLLDDLTSELDSANTERLHEWLVALEAQLFITGVEANNLISKWLYNTGTLNADNIKMFHVKQGSLVEQTITS